jgi:anti-sigma regulatory factor (Ser/Thr protein kinase)
VVDMPNRDTAPGQARRVVREAFSRWSLTVLIDDAELAVSELVTNAFKHGLPPVTLTLCQSAGRVRVDVSDARPATTTLEWPASLDTDESGRGRRIIEAVSDRSGTDEIAADGKTSYASWDVDPHSPSSG